MELSRNTCDTDLSSTCFVRYPFVMNFEMMKREPLHRGGELTNLQEKKWKRSILAVKVDFAAKLLFTSKSSNLVPEKMILHGNEAMGGNLRSKDKLIIRSILYFEH